MLPTIKSAKLYAVLESTIELKNCSVNELNDYLRTKRFVGKVEISYQGNAEINYQQGGVTNIVTREHVPLTMQELEFLLERRKA